MSDTMMKRLTDNGWEPHYPFDEPGGREAAYVKRGGIGPTSIGEADEIQDAIDAARAEEREAIAARMDALATEAGLREFDDLPERETNAWRAVRVGMRALAKETRARAEEREGEG